MPIKKIIKRIPILESLSNETEIILHIVSKKIVESGLIIKKIPRELIIPRNINILPVLVKKIDRIAIIMYGITGNMLWFE